VEAVWVWRFTTAPFKATYGRLGGDGSTTYSKDYLQASGECAAALGDVFQRSAGETINLGFLWPGGEREGKLFEAADFSSNGRLELRWETNNAPAPWKLYPVADQSPLKTFIGDPTLTTAAAANLEFEHLKAMDLDPWLIVVKLYGEPDILHVRAYLGNPPPDLVHTATAQLPTVVVSAMASVPTNGGCAVARIPFGAAPRAQKIVDRVLDALTRGPNVLLVGPPGTGKTVALEDLRDLFENGASSVLFDPAKIHDAWSESAGAPTGKVRTIVFHPSYSYEEFVIGLYPVPAASGNGVDLQPRPGPLLSLGHWASEVPNAGLLIVDEFNRGNAAAIFGDMLALLDKEKRQDMVTGQPGASIDRPYPGLSVDVLNEFATAAGTSVPEQLRLPLSLWLVAAMNSSDRSVAPLDAALRRRFSIVRVEPDYTVLADRLGISTSSSFAPPDDPTAWTPDDVSRLALALLRRLNEKIEVVLGADFLLGHSLLWDVHGSDAESAVISLCAAFDERVASTLRMTFADQDEPLAAVLGAGPPPVAGGTTSGSQIAYWLLPPADLEAVAPPRLRIRLTREFGWIEAANALRALL
jgi:5-methylcytosine-specific restriction protein B